VDWSELPSVIEYFVGYQRMLAGGARPFDEAARRELVRRDVERARHRRLPRDSFTQRFSHRFWPSVLPS
jgi:hypothetical protein